MVTDNTGPLSYWTLAPRCSSTPGSLGVFSTFFPSHGYHVDKTSKFIPVLGGGEKCPVAQPLKPAFEAFVTLLVAGI